MNLLPQPAHQKQYFLVLIGVCLFFILGAISISRAFFLEQKSRLQQQHKEEQARILKLHQQQLKKLRDQQIVPTKKQRPPEKSQKNIIEKTDLHGRRLSLNFEDIKIRTALQIIAEFTRLNIVTTDSVRGNLTLQLKDVPWEQALDIILQSHDLTKKQYDNILFIAPAAEISAREKSASLEHTLIPIHYGKASEIAALLKDKSHNLLSNRGNVTVDTRTNQLWIRDLPEHVTEIRQLIEQIDIPLRQVLIEAHIVNVNQNFERNLGIKFNFSRPKPPTESANIDQKLNFNTPSNTSNNFAFMRLADGILLDLELSAMESEGGGRVISRPRLLTTNQQAATIQAGEEIPYQEKTSSGATNVAFKKAVLSLRVTPQITPDNRVILKLNVNQDKRSPSKEVNGVPAIDTRQIETQVLVNNGQTLVLGGIYEETEHNKVQRVPFLGKLPIIGNVFQNTQKNLAKTELLVFITPRIVTPDSAPLEQEI